MEEFTQAGYYGKPQKFVDNHLSVKICLSKFLSDVLFNGDISRVVYSEPSLAFRKRMESNYNGMENGEIRAESLNLPFATFCQTSDFTPDDRLAAKNAALSIIGKYDTSINSRIRNLAYTQKYQATIFFSRRDDIRYAAHLLNWEQNPEFPIQTYTEVNYGGVVLPIPVIITINSVNTNPDYKEKDFLSKSRIFPVIVEFTILSYQLHVWGTDLIKLPFKFYNYDKGELKPDSVCYTERAVLFFGQEYFDFDVDSEKVNKENEEVAEIISTNISQEDEDFLRMACSIPNDYLMNAVVGIFNEETTTKLNTWKYNDAKTTVDDKGIVTAWIDFAVKPSDMKFFDYAEVLVPSRKDPIIINDAKVDHFLIKELYPNSQYNCIILTHSKNNEVSTYTLSFTTKNWEYNIAPQTDNINPEVKSPSSAPKKVTGLAGLIGQEFEL